MPDDPKPWMKQPGELHDSRGVPIYPGDLLRLPHFIGARRKRYYLYHVAVFRDGAMLGVPVSHLDTSKVRQGGTFLLSQVAVDDARVISGYGPSGILSYEDRKRVKVTKKGATDA